ncbi:LCP family protein [Actinomadura parmotrematis]|uniref:LCP family protein n=1 Tax=Actinomadura parmotrematis TaxID=2864039 RepID=A0ABS7G6V2_9ACTN|nr:LCP family protein [Actinomadura parmotrematis]MBW8487358.1 LCP family protein [Actinomadura parmotrematis]
MGTTSRQRHAEPAPGEDERPAPRRSRRRRVLIWTAAASAAVLAAGALAAGGFYWRLDHNIRHEDTDRLIGSGRPPKLNAALNILLLGTDDRSGANAAYGPGMTKEPPRSDTMILLHLSPGGDRAIGASLPRDLMVPIPSCTRADGTRTGAVAAGMLNSSFTLGGASCTVKTVEGFAHVKIDHFMQVDFTSFKNVTTAVGGVEVCLPRAVDDRDSKLRLGKGRHVIEGETALAYVRNRHGLGDGSDLQRIRRQQQFMASLARKVLSAGTLTDPTRLLPLAEAGTKSLTTDDGLTVTGMVRIAQGMRDLTAGGLRFVTVPTGAYAPDHNRVALSEPAAGRFFDAVRADRTLPGASASPSAGPPAGRRVQAKAGKAKAKTGVKTIPQQPDEVGAGDDACAPAGRKPDAHA